MAAGARTINASDARRNTSGELPVPDVITDIRVPGLRRSPDEVIIDRDD
jgi:hypothetical protein